MKAMIVAVALMSGIGSVAAQQQPQTFTFTVDSQELGIIGTALRKLPFEQSAPVIGKITEQIQKQDAAAKAAAAEAAKDKK